MSLYLTAIHTNQNITQSYVVLCCVVLCCVVLCCAVLCCAVLCCAVLCCVVLCCVVLCCVVLCCVVLRHTPYQSVPFRTRPYQTAPDRTRPDQITHHSTFVNTFMISELKPAVCIEYLIDICINDPLLTIFHFANSHLLQHLRPDLRRLTVKDEI